MDYRSPSMKVRFGGGRSSRGMAWFEAVRVTFAMVKVVAAIESPS